jgi:hypothetical protein
MKLTIVPQDSVVGKDGGFYHQLDLSSAGIPVDVQALQWDGSAGHIEFYGDAPNQEISELPDWATACVTVWDAAKYAEENPPEPSDEEKVSMNESRAESLLLESDWSVLTDVNLSNQDEWVAYRAALREIAKNPTASPSWPTKPAVIWA